jgi:platelet-activating factor acetylhydrolase IB subunit alpha
LQGSHKSLIAYLTAAGLSNSAAALREEIKIGDSFDDATRKKYEGLLEKKWTSVVRLQKKVLPSFLLPSCRTNSQ